MKPLLLTLIPALALATACGHKPMPAVETRPAVRVQTIDAQLTGTPNLIEVVGTVHARLSATIAAKVTATIREVAVKPGTVVTAGQVLAKLDDRVFRAEYDRAKADHERYQALQNKAAATPAETEAVQMRYRVAEAALSDCQLVAPFAGQVTGKSCAVGDLVTPGKRLFTVEQPTDFRLEVNVPARAATSLATGKSLDCLIDATGEKCVGQVDEITPLADPATRTVLVKIALQCRQPVASGLFGRAQLPLGERIAMFVPQAAVHERGQLTYVFVAADGKAQMRLVKTGPAHSDSIELLAGVQAGERIIVAGEVADGQPVTQ